jgi:hypothetical protein
MLPLPRLLRVLPAAVALLAMLLPVTARAAGGGEALGLALLFWMATNAALYLVMLLCWVGAATLWGRRRTFAIVLLVVGCAPPAHYAFDYARTQREPQRRARELAALPRQPVVPRSPHSIEAFRGFYIERELQTLVAARVVPEVFITTGNVTQAYVRQEGWECLADEISDNVQAEVRRVVLARQAFRACARAEQRERPPEASLQLFVGEAAPHGYRGPACTDSPGRALELRWAPRHGDALVAFFEPGLRTGYKFPPVLLPYPPPRVWDCTREPYDPDRYDAALRRGDAFRFVAEALGYRSIDDFPRSQDEDAVPQALQQLQSRLRARSAHQQILALMGQWPATPATDALIGAGPIAAESRHVILIEAARLLGDPRQRERQQQLYPHLASHVPALLQACALYDGRWDTAQPCGVLAKVAERAKQ